MRPCVVFGSQLIAIGAPICVGVDQAVPALIDEMKPTVSWHVDVEQFAVG